MPIPEFRFDDPVLGLPRQPVPVRLAYFATGLTFHQFVGLLAVRHFDRYEYLTGYESPADGEPGAVRREFYEDLAKVIPLDATERDKVKQLPLDHFVWSDELASAFCGYIDDVVGREEAHAAGMGLEWKPAFHGLLDLIAECADLKGLSATPRDTASTLPPYLIRRSPAGGWELRFEGRSCGPISHRKGLAYLKHLLQKPGKPISAIDLSALVEHRSVSASVYSRTQAARADLSDISDPYEGSLSVTTGGHGGELLDDISIRQYKARLEELVELRKEAEELGDSGTLEGINTQTEWIETELKRGLRPDGRKKVACSTNKRAYDAVRNNIIRTIERINTHCPDLGEHLRQYIRYERTSGFTYQPPTKFDWKF